MSEELPLDLYGRMDVLGEAERELAIMRASRKDKMAEIAEIRWTMAKMMHLTETGQPLDFDRWPFLKKIYQNKAEYLVLIGAAGWGKASAIDAKVHTPAGWARMGDLSVGDVVSTPSGKNASIVGVFPQGKIPIHRVTFSDGRSTEVSGDHLWKVYSKTWRLPKLMTTNDIAIEMAAGRRLRISLPRPVQKPRRKLPIDPYLLGLLLGDGGMTQHAVRYSTIDAELRDSMKRMLQPIGMELHKYPSDRPSDFNIRVAGGAGAGHGKGPLNRILTALRLKGTNSYNKFIPTIFKEASVKQRMAILQGLMDTDGYASLSTSFSSSSKQLAMDVQYLVRSLGGVAVIAEKIAFYEYLGQRRQGAISYKVNIRFPNPRELFRLERKRAAVSQDYQYAKTLYVSFKSIEAAGEKEAQCIMLDDVDHLYITDDYIVTHNTEYLIVDDAASAYCGMRVFHVMENATKRDKFVSSRLNPCFQQVTAYRLAMDQAKARNATADSTRFKHFGAGSINLVGSETESDFTTHRADKSTVDEHQGCNVENLAKIYNRMTGSPFSFQTIAGNPREIGTASNMNLDWQWKQTDMQQWKVPCTVCAKFQSLSWWTHFVEQETNEFGGIISVKIRDPEWEHGMAAEPRPMCVFCESPMNRLDRDGDWFPTYPGRWKMGFQLSSLYNPTADMNKLYDHFLAAIPDPSRFQNFVNDQLGEAFTSAGTKITTEMLDRCSTGQVVGLPPYVLFPVSDLNWR